MKIQENKHHKKRNILIACGVVALIIAGGVAATMYLNRDSDNGVDRPENTPDYNEATSEQKRAGEQAKEDFINKQDDEGKKNTTPPDSEPSNVNVTITSAGKSDDVFQIRTMIEVLDDQGICQIELTKNGQTAITMEAGTQVLGSYSVCKGFDIPVSGMQKGTWLAKVTYKGNGTRGVAERSVDIQ